MTSQPSSRDSSVDVDLVAVLAYHVHHVDGNDHGDAQLDQLGGQVQVTLQVGAIDDIQDGVGSLTESGSYGPQLLPACRETGSRCPASP